MDRVSFSFTFHDVIANCIVLLSNRKDESFVSIPSLGSWKIRLANCGRKKRDSCRYIFLLRYVYN